MYYIVTDNKEIINFAKRKGANILNSDESIIIKPEVKNTSQVYTFTKAEKPINNKSKAVNANLIETFFSGFYYANKKTLGFECVKYIMENGIDCEKNNYDEIYRVLAHKFDTKIKVIKQSITYFLNNCRFNDRFGMPKEFKTFYEKHIKYEKKSIEQMNFAFISICEMYLRRNKKR